MAVPRLAGAPVGTPVDTLDVAPLVSDVTIELIFASLLCSFGLLHLRRIGETIAPGFALGQTAERATAPPAAPWNPPAAAHCNEQGLARLREFGKLKDAGYPKEVEFQRIKQRILDSHS